MRFSKKKLMESAKVPGWVIGLMAPVFMGVLGYLFFHVPSREKPQKPAHVVLVVFDRCTDKISEKGGTPPALFYQAGLCGKIKPVSAVNIDQFLLEMMTGKDFRVIPDAGWEMNKETLSLDAPNVWTKHRWAVIWDILERYGRSTRVWDGAEVFLRLKSLPNDDLLILRLSLDDLGPNISQDIFRTFKKIAGENDVLIVVQPFSGMSNYIIFKVNQWLYQHGYIVLNEKDEIDWERTKAVCFDQADMGLRLNRDVFFRNGFQKGSEIGKTKKQLARQLTQMKIPGSKRVLFKKILDGGKYFSQKFPNQVPDVVFRPGKDIPFIHFDMSITPRETLNPLILMGDQKIHCISRAGGWIFLFGLPFRSGNRIPECVSADIAPSILFLMKIPIADDMTGRVLFPMFREQWQCIRRPSVESYETRNFRVRQPFNESLL